MSDKILSLNQTPYVRIIEQPARGGTRFRYECEGRSAGSIPGVNSTPDITTYPAIQIMNYTGSALAIVSCVTKDFPYRQHPHNLVGERCSNGIAKIVIDNKDMIATFPSMGIQCAKRNDIRVRLKRRQALQIDPFDCGFDHMNCSSFEINLSAVRLCFQILIEDPKTSQYSIPLQPVVSDVIFDKKSCNELNIIDISSHTISSNGSKLMLFTSFVLRDDIEVRFYELDDQNQVKWQDSGKRLFICN
ncbi:embryonic polarity protein dorsal-like [Oppia nitens]|uniref:embryonic polarity protein dorsal-like n=1 Tax=Oppia nitens TaxID=1686743 RepID=UPI0023D987D3|nr:embryonic polarity protein dorsal-like [Oppia nitens]